MLTLVPLAFRSEIGDGSAGDGFSFVSTIGRYQTFDSRPLPNPEGMLHVTNLAGYRLTYATMYSGSAMVAITYRDDHYAC
jgi:hypothetical protein